MKAVKANKEYSINESQSKAYQSSGFDIVGDDGKVVAYGRGKTVPYAEYASLKEKLEALEAEKEEKKAVGKASKKEGE